MAKIVSGEKYWAQLTSEEIIEKAKLKADRIMRDAEAESKVEREKAFKEGVEEAKSQNVEQIINTSAAVVEYLSSLEGKVVDLVCSSLRKILGEMDKSELASKVVSNALGIMRNQKQVTLRVNAQDLPRVKDNLHKIMAAYPAMSFLDLVEDPRLSEGGCILESEMGVVDASLNKQLEAIESAMQKSFGSKSQ